MMENSHKEYTAICSERTLQSNSNGFFMDFVRIVVENAGGKWINTEFGKLKTDRQRIRYVYESEKTKSQVTKVLSNVQEIYRQKNAGVSQAKRLEAEKAFSNGDLKASLLLYSQSILRSPKTSENSHFDSGGTLALGLWGRSKVLLALQEYPLSLNDIQQALKENLPTVYKAEAFWKMAICYKHLQEENRARVSFDLAQKLLGSNEKLLGMLEKDRNDDIQNYDNNKVTEKNGSTRQTRSWASKKITFKEKEGLGRFAVAKKDIKTGEDLVVEQPYVACLLPDMFGTHCHHCFERLKAPIGCPDCSNVAFCSAICKEASCNSYHRHECKYLDLLIGSGMSVLAHAALRMVTQNELARCLEIYEDRSKEKVYALCTNAGQRSAEDFLQRTLMAAFLLRCLQKCGYFGCKNGYDVMPTEEEYRIGELLLHHLQMLQFNAHEVYETRVAAGSNLKGSKIVYIGIAVYPTVSLFNHDCYPAVTRHFSGKTIVIKASRPARRGDPIAENYGPTFTRRSKRDRQRALRSRYWFDCWCAACLQDWPTIEHGLDDATRRVRCTSPGCSYLLTIPVSKDTVRCPRCEKDVCLKENIDLLRWCEEQYEKGFRQMDSKQYEKAIDTCCKAIDVFHRVSAPPHKGTHLAQETLQLCVASYGNVAETLVKKS
ncbi:unnamed protein product [Phaedon cochleariae]|uniref:SET and MYND domain-containing protein 4 n=1 Tax=Phaedon cochleariae TaxID=80249 RepID=A0A9N9WZX5_PHACE|nr:unnamed protein product [Phaedon cochleariae]